MPRGSREIETREAREDCKLLGYKIFSLLERWFLFVGGMGLVNKKLRYF